METVQIENTSSSKKVRRMFGFDLDWWNDAMLLSLGAAALAAVALAVSSTIVIKLQKQEAIDAGVKIAELNVRAKEAELKLEQLHRRVAPRKIDHDAVLKAMNGQPAS